MNDKTKIEKILEEHNISAYALSKRSGVNESTISMWKQRDNLENATILNMMKVAKALNVTVDDLIKIGGIEI